MAAATARTTTLMPTQGNSWWLHAGTSCKMLDCSALSSQAPGHHPTPPHWPSCCATTLEIGFLTTSITVIHNKPVVLVVFR